MSAMGIMENFLVAIFKKLKRNKKKMISIIIYLLNAVYPK